MTDSPLSFGSHISVEKHETPAKPLTVHFIFLGVMEDIARARTAISHVSSVMQHDAPAIALTADAAQDWEIRLDAAIDMLHELRQQLLAAQQRPNS